MMQAGATRLLDLRGEVTPPRYRVPVEHFPLEDLRYGQHEMLLAAARRVHQAVSAGETVGIYCQAGVSRTAAVAILYLMLQGMSRSEATRTVTERRPQALPAVLLEQSLVELEEELPKAPEPFSVEVSGVTVSGVRRRGSGPPLVLFHGAYGDWTHWGRNLEGLSTASDVYALDLPGFGDSGDWPGEFTYPGYLNLLAEAVRAVSSSPVILAGYSYGASLAARLALHAPDLARAAVLVSLVGRTGDPASHHKVEERHFQNPMTVAERLSVLSDNLRNWHVADPAVVDERVVAMTYKSVFFTRLTPRRLRTTPSPMPTLEVLERLTGVPLLMIWGRQDAFCQPSAEAWAEACQRVRPGAQQVMIADAAHWCQFERPEVVNRAVLRFVTSLDEGPGPIQEGGSGAGR